MKQYTAGQRIKVTPKGKTKRYADVGIVFKSNYLKTWHNGTKDEVISYIPDDAPLPFPHIISERTHQIEVLK